MIAIVDYGAGNLRSVVKAFSHLGADTRIARAPQDLRNGITGVVIPGVGHFRATRALDDTWRNEFLDALDRGQPLLGICLGMQWLYEGSDEAPELSGLGVLNGRVTALRGDVKVPHVGWNTIQQRLPVPLFEGVGDEAYAYFTHGFAAPADAIAAGVTMHGSLFTSVVDSPLVTGMQFHPEKSGATGMRLLSNWVRRCLPSA